MVKNTIGSLLKKCIIRRYYVSSLPHSVKENTSFDGVHKSTTENLVCVTIKVMIKKLLENLYPADPRVFSRAVSESIEG